MENARRFILYLVAIIGTWLLISFGGAMLDSPNAAFWSDSLMWSLLSCMVVAPTLVFLLTSPSGNSASASSKSFVDEKSASQNALFSDSEDEYDWREDWRADWNEEYTDGRVRA